MGSGTRGYRDLQQHLDALSEAGLLHRIGEAIDKDAEMHPLVRWQYRGGVPEKDRKAWLFNNVTDAKGKHYDMPVLVGGLAGVGSRGGPNGVRHTPLRQRANLMVAETVATLMRLIETPDAAAPRKTALDCPLIVRGSARVPLGWTSEG